jgi:hypothetical protein
MKGASKDVRKLFREAEARGWTVRRRRSGHYVLEGPQNEKVFCSGTPTDHRAIENMKKDLSRAGLELD